MIVQMLLITMYCKSDDEIFSVKNSIMKALIHRHVLLTPKRETPREWSFHPMKLYLHARTEESVEIEYRSFT